MKRKFSVIIPIVLLIVSVALCLAYMKFLSPWQPMAAGALLGAAIIVCMADKGDGNDDIAPWKLGLVITMAFVAVAIVGAAALAWGAAK